MVQALKRMADADGAEHLQRAQFFVVAVLDQVIGLQLSGLRACGQVNRFAFKHVLDPSAKDGVNAEEKARRRLMHRTFPAGKIPGTADERWHGAKKAVQPSLTHQSKYGDALPHNANYAPVKGEIKERYDVANTVIDLSAITLDAVLEKIARAFVAENIARPAQDNPANAVSAVVEIDFEAPCVLTTRMWFDCTDERWGTTHSRKNKVSLVGARPTSNKFEIYHLGKYIP